MNGKACFLCFTSNIVSTHNAWKSEKKFWYEFWLDRNTPEERLNVMCQFEKVNFFIKTMKALEKCADRNIC